MIKIKILENKLIQTKIMDICHNAANNYLIPDLFKFMLVFVRRFYLLYVCFSASFVLEILMDPFIYLVKSHLKLGTRQFHVTGYT